MQRDERRNHEQSAAQLVGEHVREDSSYGGIDYTIKVRNVGKSPARDVSLCLAERSTEGELSSPVTMKTRLGTLAPGDDWLECTLRSPEPRRPDRLHRRGTIVAYWVDGNGEHRDREIGLADLYH